MIDWKYVTWAVIEAHKDATGTFLCVQINDQTGEHVRRHRFSPDETVTLPLKPVDDLLISPGVAAKWSKHHDRVLWIDFGIKPTSSKDKFNHRVVGKPNVAPTYVRSAYTNNCNDAFGGLAA
jgi:hypothetical protein